MDNNVLVNFVEGMKFCEIIKKMPTKFVVNSMAEFTEEVIMASTPVGIPGPSKVILGSLMGIKPSESTKLPKRMGYFANEKEILYYLRY